MEWLRVGSCIRARAAPDTFRATGSLDVLQGSGSKVTRRPCGMERRLGAMVAEASQYPPYVPVKLTSKVPSRVKDLLPSNEKPPITILHGMLGSASNWRGFLARSDLFKEDQYVAAVDLRNHGSSEHAPTMSYPEMCGDVLEYANQLGVSRAHLIGHSMGGKVAMTLALRHPESVASLVVVDISPVSYSSTMMHTAIMDAMSDVDLATITSVQRARFELSKSIPCVMTREFVLTNLVANVGGDTKLKWKVNIEALRAGILDGDLSSFSAPDGAVYDGPTLFIRGAKSNYVQDQHYERIAELFPNFTTRTIEGAGHWVHHEKQNDFVAMVKDWYSQNVDL